MSFCPRCGAPTTPAMTFCTACGEKLAQTAYVPQAPAPATPGGTPPGAITPAIPAPAGPAGVTMEPWLVLVLTLVTFGVYGFFYWWRVSKEVDAYRGTPGHANQPIKTAIIVGSVVMVLMVVLFALFLGALVDAGLSQDFQGEPTPEQVEAILGGMAGAFAIIPLIAIGALVAFVFWLVGQWRVWSAIEADERRRGHPSPLSPGLQLVFVLVPYINIVTTWIALWRTQDRLNQMWAGRVG